MRRDTAGGWQSASGGGRSAAGACGTFEEVFSFQNLYKAGKLCCKGVGWKGSTQRYLGDIISNTAKTRKALMEGKWKTKGFHESI